MLYTFRSNRFSFLDVKESYVAIKIFGNCGMFYFAVPKQYTEEISCFQSVSSFTVLSDALGACLTVFSFHFPPNLVMLSAYNLLFGTWLCCRNISKLLPLQPPFWETNISLFTYWEILALQMSQEEPYCP